MAFQPSQFAVSFISGSSLSQVITMPGSWLYCNLFVPTMTTGFGAATTVMIQASVDGVNFFRYGTPTANTAAAVFNDFSIASAASLKWVNVPGFGFNFARLETTAVATASVSVMSPFIFLMTPNQ